MPPLNPFLRAFFRSTLPAQCTPIQSHILLVPTSEVLLTSRDRDTNALYADLASSEEFLGSHVLRIPGNALSNGVNTKDTGSMRESRGKAKQFTTVNGRTVVIKDSAVFSNKGFKTLNQAQLLQDATWYPDTIEVQQWLIYYISKPLVGTLEVVSIPSAVLSDPTQPAPASPDTQRTGPEPSHLSTPQKKDIKSFNDLLNSFPMIARQMQPGLERLFKEFRSSVEKPLPVPHYQEHPHETRSNGAIEPSVAVVLLGKSPVKPPNGHDTITRTATDQVREQEDIMRVALENAVTAAIDLFQLVDKQQLSLLGATTDLTGPMVERLIERYVTEMVHDTVIFPTVCAIRRPEDQELEQKIRQMESIDISQVGIQSQGGRQAKQDLLMRIGRGVEEFRKMGVAGSPQEMMEILLATEKAVTIATTDESIVKDLSSEKPSTILTINADTLVSLLLVVVIRSQVRHLQARLFYMRHFVFIDDVEGGELGYALSTFEAVLSYLMRESANLRRASRRNKALWEATKSGDVTEMKNILEPDSTIVADETIVEELEAMEMSPGRYYSVNRDKDLPDIPLLEPEDIPLPPVSEGESSDGDTSGHNSVTFESQSPVRTTPNRGKRVSMDTRSLSESSSYSFNSRTITIDSKGSGIEGDTSIDRLSQTQDPTGESVPMMAVESRQPDSLRYILGLQEYYPMEKVLEDAKEDGTTLLSAAMQLGHPEIIDMILDVVYRAKDERVVLSYLARRDSRGRTAAHYLFNAPHLIPRIGRLLPWRLKDNNGQTPLFALCRSYDHSSYREMVRNGIAAAQETQKDGLPLHLDDHFDGKGNTLLHVVNDPQLALQLMAGCDSDVNATNDKKFTALMVASKYGRVDMVHVLFGDPRVDLYARELRGLTAVELAKDDEVRNKMDDLILLSHPPDEDGRTTSVVRSFFVEDATTRFVLKSAAPLSKSTITITTCRRSLSDFENLAKWLSIENPASWLPPVPNFRSPFQIPSKPSRAVLRDTQVRLDSLLKTLLAHSTFSTHEMLWEFILAPEIQPDMMAERSGKKAEARQEMVKEEYEPVEEVKDVESFVGHAKDMTRGFSWSTRTVVRRVNRLRLSETDLSDALSLLTRGFNTLVFLPPTHRTALTRAINALHPSSSTSSSSSPLAQFHTDLVSISSTIHAMLTALSRPTSLIASMSITQKAIDRHLSSLRRSDRWPLGLLDDTRTRIHDDARAKVEQARGELEGLGKELRYTQQTVAAELAEWQVLHGRMGRKALRTLAERMVVLERSRLEGLRRAVRGVLDPGTLPAPAPSLSSTTLMRMPKLPPRPSEI